MNPLDLIFFKGTDFISSMVLGVQKIAENDATFSHVGFIVTRELLDIPELKPGILYVMESTVNYVNDRVDGRRIGVQIRELQTAIGSYKKDVNSEIAWCRLINNPFLTDKEKTKTTFVKFYNEYIDSFYNMNILDLMSAAFPCIVRARKKLRKVLYQNEEIYVSFFDNKWMFCSELVMEIYKRLSIVGDINPVEYMPVEILDLDVIDKPRYL